MVEPIVIEGQRAWLKQYAKGRRVLALGLLNVVAHHFKLDALRPPPHRGGQGACRTESRRLRELHAQGVNVPQLLGSGEAALLLEDNGCCFNICLRRADPVGRDVLVATALQAIAAAHATGAYFGQPLPRNLTWDGTRVGFIDFEEDPLEVMNLVHAQARDWLMFAYGAARYYPDRPRQLQLLMTQTMREIEPRVIAHVHAVSWRLHRLARTLLYMGRPARRLAQAILIVHAASRR